MKHAAAVNPLLRPNLSRLLRRDEGEVRNKMHEAGELCEVCMHQKQREVVVLSAQTVKEAALKMLSGPAVGFISSVFLGFSDKAFILFLQNLPEGQTFPRADTELMI